VEEALGRDRAQGRALRAIAYAVLALAALLSLVLVQVLKPTSLEAAALLSAWLLLPYALLAVLLAFRKAEISWTTANGVVCVVVAAGGLLFLVDTIFLRPDAQGGIAVIFTPVYQMLGIALLLPVSYWLMRKA
jgi:hypothetical protein